MRTDEVDFDLPAKLIAQEPTRDRAAARLLCYDRASRAINHRQFGELPRLLRPGDLLVFNDTKVLPARFMLRKASGGAGEGVFIEEVSPGRGRALLKNGGEATPGLVV